MNLYKTGVIRYVLNHRSISERWTYRGGAKRDRTADLLRATQALSQLSYSPMITGYN